MVQNEAENNEKKERSYVKHVELRADLEHRKARKSMQCFHNFCMGVARSTYDLRSILRTPGGDLATSARSLQGVSFVVRTPHDILQGRLKPELIAGTARLLCDVRSDNLRLHPPKDHTGLCCTKHDIYVKKDIIKGKAKWLVYINHFLIGWDDNIWWFALGLFLVEITPQSLTFTATYGLLSGAAVLLFGAVVGDWVDRTPRLTVARVSVLFQNSALIFCCLLIYTVIEFKAQISTVLPQEGLLYFMYALIILIAIAANLTSMARQTAIERDWIVEIFLSATMRGISLLTMVITPIITGQILSRTSHSTGALVVAGWNFLTIFLEATVFIFYYAEAWLEDLQKLRRCLCWPITGSIVFHRYAVSQGLSEDLIGGLLAAAAASGIVGTLLYPRIRRWLGLRKTGLVALGEELTSLTLCVISVFAPGSPFDPLYYIRDKEMDLPLHSTPRQLQLAMNYSTTTLSHFQIVNSTDVFISNTTLGTLDAEGPSSLVSISLLMAGIIGARVGLWMADLTITQLFLESVDVTERGIVAGFQNALNQLMEMLKYVVVILLPLPQVFGYLVFISYGFIALGWILFAVYVKKTRGFLVLARYSLEIEQNLSRTRKPGYRQQTESSSVFCAGYQSVMGGIVQMLTQTERKRLGGTHQVHTNPVQLATYQFQEIKDTQLIERMKLFLYASCQRQPTNPRDKLIMPKQVDPCQKQACAIQDCLQAKDYQEDKCSDIIQAMVACCEKFGDKSGCCSGFLKGQKKKTKQT
ncbi:S40A1-like protein [Mya arenaria]|uniref:S40A1-like protein n=1 Tax=Mya arenaria TaxID=6604 RepID=A0ABY7G171_MYAAR|nr:S40A1-like protein [Mya arenaria]